MRHRIVALLPAMLMTGCYLQRVHHLDPVTVYPTATPGVAWVRVASETCVDVDGDRNKRACADYMLLCDARRGDGMHCSIPPEVASTRISRHPNSRASTDSFDAGVATLEGVVTIHDVEGDGANAPAATSPNNSPALVDPATFRSSGRNRNGGR